MCTQQKYIYNRVSGKRILVKCGHCESCMQEKANNRALRIRSNLRPGYICVMFGLTYRNECVPYFHKSDLYDGVMNLPVYRDSVTRYVRTGSDYDITCKCVRKKTKLTEVDCSNLSYTPYDVDKLPLLTNMDDRDKCGIIYYKDVQNFIKRLRINLLRWHKYDCNKKHIQFYQCSEYGGDYSRPHFHVLAYIPASDNQLFKSTVRKTWTFDDGSWKRLSYEIAYGPAKYVSGYVNKSDNLSKIFRQKPFSQKWSYSHGFGVSFKPFQLQEVIQKIYSGDLMYTVGEIKNGIFKKSDFLLPKYVINRYFPKFKGYCRLTVNEAQSVLAQPELLTYEAESNNSLLEKMEYSSEDLYKTLTMLKGKHKLFESLNLDPTTYAFLYERAWCLYYSTVYKLQFADVEKMDDYKEVYENTYEIKRFPNLSPTLVFDNVDDIKDDPNKYQRNILRDRLKSDVYKRSVDHHKFNQKVYKFLNG